MIHKDGRQLCIILANCMGTALSYLLPISEDFRKNFQLYHLGLNPMAPPDGDFIERGDLDACRVIIYNHPEALASWKGTPFHGSYVDFLGRIPGDLKAISLPWPHFLPYWPFHCEEPRNNNPNRPHNIYGELPVYRFGDSYILNLLAEGRKPEDVISHYVGLDIPNILDIDGYFSAYVSHYRSLEDIATLKYIDFVLSRFRTAPLFNSINHGSNVIWLHFANQILDMLGCRAIDQSALDRITHIISPVEIPIHPSIGRYFGADYISDSRRYCIDGRRLLTFAEYVEAYTLFA